MSPSGTTALEGWTCVQPKVAGATTSSASIGGVGGIVIHGGSITFSFSSGRHVEGWLVGTACWSRFSPKGVAGMEVWAI